VSSGDKGNFKTELPKELLDAALDAVRKREDPGVEVPVEPGAEAPEAPAPAPAAAANPEPAEAAEPTGPSEADQLRMELEVSMAKGRELMGKLKDEHERVLRATADLENFKKRALKEREETQKFGNEKLLKDFIPVVDNIDRALESGNSASIEALRKGVEMIRKLLEDTLAKHGVKGFSAKGKPFDPNFHEAMTQAETDEVPPNHVANEVLRGYTLNERLVRPALVVVSKAKSAPIPAEPASTEPKTDGAPGGKPPEGANN
jgi:molecular chaperone GrpE